MAVALDEVAGPAPLYDPRTRCFDGPRVRAAILARGFTVGAFCKKTGLSENTMGRVLLSRTVSDGTVVTVYQGLESEEPLRIAG